MPTTLYGASTLTTSYTTVLPTTTTIDPYGSTSLFTTTECLESVGPQCVSSTTQTATLIADFFFTQTRTTSFTTVVLVTSVASYPTATLQDSPPNGGTTPTGVSQTTKPTGISNTVAGSSSTAPSGALSTKGVHKTAMAFILLLLASSLIM